LWCKITSQRGHDQSKNVFDLNQVDKRTPNKDEAAKLCLRMTRVMLSDAFWKQAFTAALTTACKGRATPFCLHAGPKAMLTFACSLGWLVSAFHKTENKGGAI